MHSNGGPLSCPVCWSQYGNLPWSWAWSWGNLLFRKGELVEYDGGGQDDFVQFDVGWMGPHGKGELVASTPKPPPSPLQHCTSQSHSSNRHQKWTRPCCSFWCRDPDVQFLHHPSCPVLQVKSRSPSYSAPSHFCPAQCSPPPDQAFFLLAQSPPLRSWFLSAPLGKWSWKPWQANSPALVEWWKCLPGLLSLSPPSCTSAHPFPVFFFFVPLLETLSVSSKVSYPQTLHGGLFGDLWLHPRWPHVGIFQNNQTSSVTWRSPSSPPPSCAPPGWHFRHFALVEA